VPRSPRRRFARPASPLLACQGPPCSSALCATRATARTWLSRRCATVRSAEFMTANAPSSMHTLRCATSIPGRRGSTADQPGDQQHGPASQHAGEPRREHQRGQQRPDRQPGYRDDRGASGVMGSRHRRHGQQQHQPEPPPARCVRGCAGPDGSSAMGPRAASFVLRRTRSVGLSCIGCIGRMPGNHPGSASAVADRKLRASTEPGKRPRSSRPRHIGELFWQKATYTRNASSSPNGPDRRSGNACGCGDPRSAQL
jgi:hypothetical protein